MARDEGKAGGAFNPDTNYAITGSWTFAGAVPVVSSVGGDLVGTTAQQTLTQKSLTSPTITGTLTDSSIHPFPVQSGAAAGAASAVTEISSAHVIADNTAVDFFTVTVPNTIAGAAIRVTAASMLGDGDSTDSAIYDIGISRITGAASKAVASSKSVVGATTGATANAVLTVAVTGMTGATSAAQTFTITIKNARSAGSSDNHPTIAIAKLMNLKAGGVTIVAA